MTPNDQVVLNDVVPDVPVGDEVQTPARQVNLDIAYIGILIFCLGYFGRPEDWLNTYLGIALIGGIIALGGFLLHVAQGGAITRKRESKVLIALLIWFVLGVPFAVWRGGAFQELKDSIWKIFLLAIVMMHALVDLRRIRKLIILQTVAVTAMAWYAHSHFDRTGRAVGLGPQFGNSNDLAVLISLTVPFIVYLVITSKNFLVKLLYFATLAPLLYALVLTYSRTGFVTLLIAAAVCGYQLGWKRGRKFILVVGAVVALGGMLAFGPSDYSKTMTAIFTGDENVGSVRADAAASREDRSRLLEGSVMETLKHPIFGVGPDGFMLTAGNWHVSHNTYLQFSSEGGIPALIFFLILVKYTLSNMKETERLTEHDKTSRIWLLNGALKASFYSLLIGSFFGNYAYNFFPYFLIAYAAALNQIAKPHAENISDPDLQPAFQS